MMLMQAAMDSRLQLIFSSANIFSFCLQQPIVLHSAKRIFRVETPEGMYSVFQPELKVK